MINQQFWKNKRVLITGHNGFKGSWLSIWLKMLGAEVIGYALDPYTEYDNFVVTGLQNKITNIVGDVRDYQRLLDVFKQHMPEIVFHLAAQTIVRESYRYPKETYDVNIGGTVNLLECCRLTESVKTIINVTSDKCYENNEWIWAYRENDTLGGYDPYSSSKGCCEIVTNAFRRSFFNPEKYEEHGKNLSSVRAGNVIGGGDWRVDRLIPDCIRALEKNKPISIRNPKAIRPWQHAFEPLSGYLLLASKMHEEPNRFCGAWNFGPFYDSMITVGEIADLVTQKWKGSNTWEETSSKDSLSEANTLRLDITKALTLLEWRPIWSIEEAVKVTIDWYKNYKMADMYEFCKKQIASYQDYISYDKVVKQPTNN